MKLCTPDETLCFFIVCLIAFLQRISILAIQCAATAKVSEGTNRNMPARNTLVQLLALYTNPESQNARRHRQTDRRTTG